jgi:hypothetical protein
MEGIAILQEQFDSLSAEEAASAVEEYQTYA